MTGSDSSVFLRRLKMSAGRRAVQGEFIDRGMNFFNFL
jgi:hypothetical protein